jgi:hypothetical protein
VFKAARAEGRTEPLAAYRSDALVNLVCGGGAKVDTTVVVRVDAERLGGGEGLCEAVGTGAVPASEAIGAILAGAFVKIVLTDGVDITTVSHHGRHIPEVCARRSTNVTATPAYGPDAELPRVCRSTTGSSTTANGAPRPTGTWAASVPMTTTRDPRWPPSRGRSRELDLDPTAVAALRPRSC